MHPCNWSPRTVLLAGLVVCALFAGCTDPESPEPEPQPEEIVNPDKPNSNARVVLHKTIGAASTWSSLWEITPDNTGGYFFRGGYDSHYTCGRLSPAGDVVWHSRTTFSPRDLWTTAPTALAPNAPLVAGAQDSDGNGTMDTGYLSLYSTSGTLQSQLVYAADTAAVWLNSIVPTSDSTFVTVGGLKTSTTYYPFVATARLTPSGQLEKQSEAIITSLHDLYFGYATRDPDASSSTSVTIYVNSGVDAAAIHRLSLTLPTLVPWTVEWTREIAVAGTAELTVGDLRLFENNLYVVGWADDPSKPPTSSGTLWDSGIVASLTPAGTVRWATVVRITNHSEVLYGILPTSDALYVLGKSGAFIASGQEFGYGYISKLTPATGGVVANMTFGNDTYDSGFRTGMILGDFIGCGGWTLNETANGPYRAWFCTIDVRGTSSVTTESPPMAPTAPDDRAGAAVGHRRQ